ncbi:MAG: hypothetical protein ACYDAQ_15125 [Mycobacteriales bacterium]
MTKPRTPQPILAAALVAEAATWLAKSGLLGELAQSLFGGWLPTAGGDGFDLFLADAEASLATVRSQLDAERWGSEMIGMLTLAGSEPAEVEELLAERLVPLAERADTPAAQAMLVALSAVGGPLLSPAARTAQGRLSARGVAEPAWADGLGRPVVGRCWRYTGVFEDQESLVTTFRYGRKSHALCTFIDYDLGGGVKDCYVTDRVERLRCQMQRFTEEDPSTYCEDIDPADAADRLGEAVSRPECPRQLDQIRDVALTRVLLRARLALLPAPGSGAGATRENRQLTALGAEARTTSHFWVTGHLGLMV